MKEENAGRCYELAAKYILNQWEGDLIHAAVWSDKQQRMIDHALVETDTGWIYEPVTETYHERTPFFRRYSISEIKRYTKDEMTEMLCQKMTYGPWAPEVLAFISERELTDDCSCKV